MPLEYERRVIWLNYMTIFEAHTQAPLRQASITALNIREWIDPPKSPGRLKQWPNDPQNERTLSSNKLLISAAYAPP